MKIWNVILAVLTSGTGAQAIAGSLEVTARDLNQYDLHVGQLGLHRRLLDKGILVPSDHEGVFFWSENAEGISSDEQAIAIATDFINWLSNRQVQLESKDWSDMTLASQDIRSGW